MEEDYHTLYERLFQIEASHQRLLDASTDMLKTIAEQEHEIIEKNRRIAYLEKQIRDLGRSAVFAPQCPN